MDRPNLRDLTLEELEAFLAGMGKEAYRARQIMRWVHAFGVTDFADMTTLAKDFRAEIGARARLDLPELAETQVSRDGTKKALFRLADGERIESVLIPGRNHWTVCVSTQAGCRMGCRFCLTGKLGFRRQLTPAEIAGQLTVLKLRTPEGPDIKNLVMMGMGEPLANYDNTLKAIRILTSDYGHGFSSRKVTVSTCGLAPGIEQLGRDVCVNLAISLNAPDDERRSRLMPVNRKYPLSALLQACRDYPMPGRRMLTFEYILLDGVNDAPADAEALCRLLKGLRCKLNLIAFNEFPGAPFRTPTPERISAFQGVLLRNHYTAILRASKGSDILAACGQLSGRTVQQEVSP